MQSHALACYRRKHTKIMPWISVSRLIEQVSMLICMPVETNHTQARSFTATMSQSLRTAIYAGLDLRMKIRCRLSGSGPWNLLVMVVFHFLCHYPPLFTNGVRHLLCNPRESQTLACEVDTSQTSIHKRCAHDGFNKSGLSRRLKSSQIEELKNRCASAVKKALKHHFSWQLF